MFKILGNISLYLSVLYPLLYLIGFTRNSKAFKYFTAYLVIVGFVQIAMKSFKVMALGDSNLFFFVYYFVFEFILLSFFYRELLGYKWINTITGVILICIGIQYYNYPALYFVYNPIGSSITRLILVVYSMLYFYRSLQGKREFILVNGGLFIYLLSSMLVFASGNFLRANLFPTYILELGYYINKMVYFPLQLLICVEWFRNYRIIKKIE